MHSHLLVTQRRGSRRVRIIAVTVVAAVAASAVVALGWRRRAPETSVEPPPPQPAPPAEAQASAAPLPPPAATGLITPGALLDAVSPRTLLRRALRDGDPLRRLAIIADNVAEGASPREELGSFALQQPFSVVDRGGETVIAAASYARYDAFADLVASVDARAAGVAYRALHAPLERAYRALGYPDASIDAVVARALRRLEAAPVRDGGVAVAPEGGLFELVDPRLRELGDVEKHVLRMGPRNTRLLQAKARELEEALGIAGTVAAHP
jgi:hypothetical protein